MSTLRIILTTIVSYLGATSITGCSSAPPTVPVSSARTVLSAAGINDPELESLVRNLSERSGVSEETLASSAVALDEANLSSTQLRLAMLEQANAMQEQTIANAKKEFLGFSWGVGIGAVINLGEDDRVETAEVVDGIVRVTKEANDTARVFSEVHLFRRIKDDDTRGHGPFVAIQSSADELVDSFSVGYMRGWRKDAAATNSINVGFGLVLDTTVKELGNGIEEDQPLPPGENADSVRLKETSGIGLGIFVSFSY